jgi:hypothetical protein
MPGKCSFCDQWLETDEYKQWLVHTNGDRQLCLKDFDISNMGEAALKSHAKGSSHQQKIKLSSSSVKENPTTEVFFGSKSESTRLTSLLEAPAVAKPKLLLLLSHLWWSHQLLQMLEH